VLLLPFFTVAVPQFWRITGRERIAEALKNYIPDTIIIIAALAFYTMHGYYVGFLRPETQTVMLYLALAYIILAFPLYTFYPFKDPHVSKGRAVFTGIIRYFRERDFGKREKIIALFILVKFFYIPLMLNFVFDNAFWMNSNIINISQPLQRTPEAMMIDYVYPFSLALLFFIDTAFFAFGYLVEADFLKNRVRSVEPTFLGWAVTLLTYPPFNSVYSQFFPWVANDFVHAGEYTLWLRICVIVLIVIYVWASVALGAKASNLTNRGIVGKGPYKYIRHPAYASKNAAWWLSVLPVLSFGSFVSMAAWSFLYYLRAVTEERHLSQDHDYVEYKNNVKYMFVPRLF